MAMSDTGYLLGDDADELRRLEDQGRALAPATDAILTLAGIGPGMRVVDLGSGPGDVSIAVAGKVGQRGAVVGVDQSAAAIAWARQRTERAGLSNVSFVEGDLTTANVEGEFDAVVGRLVLLYTPDPAAVLRRYRSRIRPGGVVVSMEFEMTAAGTLPETTLSHTVIGWITAAFRRSGFDPLLGARLGGVFRQAGLGEPVMVGIQGYLEPGDPTGPRMAASMVRRLLPVIERTGVADPADIDIDSLEQRLAADLADHGAMFKPPTLVGAWAHLVREDVPTPGSL